MEVTKTPATSSLGDLTASETLAQAGVPANLPVADASVLASAATSLSTTTYIDPSELEDETVSELTEDMRELENQAHSHHVLLSSDAMRYFIAETRHEVDRGAALEQVMQAAKTAYPTEDGWIVLNLSRMQEMYETANRTIDGIRAESTELVRTPLGAGSLAEAIVAGDVIAAYRMIEHRPMVALADATADIDAVYRTKQGMEVEHNQISELLKTSVADVELTKLENVLRALTTAIDGTYPDELSAVKIAIMKAVDVMKKD